MSLATAFARTLKRLMVGGRVTEGVTWLPKLYEGLSKEFERVADYRRDVLRSTVPSDRLPDDAVADLERKYGIEYFTPPALSARKARIIERAQGGGNGGADWLQDIIQQGGFDLYVVSAAGTDPATALGKLIVSSPPGSAGLGYATQYEIDRQYSAAVGDSTTMYGTRSFPDKLTPNPLRYSKEAAGGTPERVFYLSPIEDTVVTDAGDLLSVTEEEYRYLRRQVIRSKFARDWCIAQVVVV